MKRLCGDARQDGGVYMECGVSDYGQPLEFFIVDSPIAELLIGGELVPVMDALNLTSRGVQLRERAGVFHVFDVVGAEHYPDVKSFLEEVRALGASRRCELPESEYAKLSRESRMILIHPRAMILNHARYYTTGKADMPPCPKALPEHDLKDGSCEPMCARLWEMDLTAYEGDTIIPPVAEQVWVKIRRTLPCGESFQGHYRHSALEPEYAPAIFVSLPITNLVLVDPSRQFDDKAQKLAGSSVDWRIVDE